MLKKKIDWRPFIQITFFIWLSVSIIGKGLSELGVNIGILNDISIHSLCPLGAVVSIYKIATVGTFVQKIHESAMVILGLTVILAVLFGPVFCGWICPFGTFQEWIHKLTSRFSFRKKIKISNRLISVLSNFRYIVLIYIVYVTAMSGKLLFQDYDPYYALYNFWTSEVAASAVIVLLMVMIASIFIDRPWCKLACPYGGLLGITNRFRIFKIKRNPDTCISCGKCDKVCPMNIEPSKEAIIKDTKCITCLKCTSDKACPIDDTLFLQGGK